MRWMNQYYAEVVLLGSALLTIAVAALAVRFLMAKSPKKPPADDLWWHIR